MVGGARDRVGGGGVAVLPRSRDGSFLQLQGRRRFPQLRVILRYEEFGEERRDLWDLLDLWCRGRGRVVFVESFSGHLRGRRLVMGMFCWRWRRLVVVMVVWCWRMSVVMKLSDVSVILHLCVIAVIVSHVRHHLVMNVFSPTRGKSVSAVHSGNKLNTTHNTSVNPQVMSFSVIDIKIQSSIYKMYRVSPKIIRIYIKTF